MAEGVRVVEELVRAGATLHGVLLAKSATASVRAVAVADLAAAHGVPRDIVSDAEFASAASTDTPQGVLAIAAVPDCPLGSLGAEALGRAVILDGLQDPGNVGTVIRTAAAFGVRTVVALPGTVEPWNAKVVRAAAGGHFHLQVTHASFPELADALRTAGVPLWAADASGRPVGTVERPPALALALGNEGGGLSDQVRRAATGFVALPMAPGIESLNVAVAGGILMHALFA
ncbi:MAG TPA: RNA methyltransferase [Gemmatimonadaceae bacterium]|nr:RNA methyltransferase [Gemmatimonadaceae bacterium]